MDHRIDLAASTLAAAALLALAAVAPPAAAQGIRTFSTNPGPVRQAMGRIQFQPPVDEVLDFSHPGRVRMADFNADGVMDIACAVFGDAFDNDGSAITILLGNGDGTFFDNPAIENARHFDVADFDGDGLVDIVTKLNGNLQVLLGTGAPPNFVPLPPIAPAAQVSTIEAADMNGDGHADLVLGNIEVRFGLGDGTFSAPFVTPGSPAMTSLQIADLDLDGWSDVVVGLHNGAIQAWMSDGSGGFVPNPSIGATTLLQTDVALVEVGLIDDDVYPDVAWFTGGQARSLRVALNDGDGTFHDYAGQPDSATVIDTYQNSTGRPLVTDFDRDGNSDIALTLGWNTILVYQGRALDQGFLPAFPIATTSQAGVPYAYDLTGDGYPELVHVLPNANTTPYLEVHVNRSTPHR